MTPVPEIRRRGPKDRDRRAGRFRTDGSLPDAPEARDARHGKPAAGERRPGTRGHR
ncbi:hypothetical protein GCM10018952_29920 [Streptosporangium vulgare]